MKAVIKPSVPQHCLLLFSIILTPEKQLRSCAGANDTPRGRPEEHGYQCPRFSLPVIACNWVTIFSWYLQSKISNRENQCEFGEKEPGVGFCLTSLHNSA